MKLSMKFLSAIALAIALTPFAAQAKNATQTANGGYQTVVQCGQVAQVYPASVGG